MTGPRLSEQLQLAFAPVDDRRASAADGDGAEPVVAEREPERPAVTDSLMEAVCERENLKKALRRVKTNKGSPGIDGMTVDQLPDYLRAHWPQHRDELYVGTYTPSPVKRVEIPKPHGGVRKLGIPTVLDRFIQQAVLQVLQPEFDPTFSTHSYGFRPGRSAHQAVAAAQAHLASGHRWVVDLDLEKFFDRVNHDLLMGRLAQRVRDTRVLKLVRAFLNAGVLEEGLVSVTEEGTPQGGPRSPLLSNIVLHAFGRSPPTSSISRVGPGASHRARARPGEIRRADQRVGSAVSGKFMRWRRAWKDELVVRREADLAAHVVELTRLAEYPAQPLRQGPRAHRHHQKGVALLNGARDQGDDIVGEPGGCGRTRTHAG